VRLRPQYTGHVWSYDFVMDRTHDGTPQTETEWHRITCFNGVGKRVAEHVIKGAMIMVTGRNHYTLWTDSTGQSRYGCEIIAEQVDFLAKAQGVTCPPLAPSI